MPRSKTLLTCLATASVCLVGVTIAGPLAPPSGPIADTSPDLEQIFDAVTASSAPACGSPPVAPGSAELTTLTLDGIGTFQLYEYDLSYLLDTSGPGVALVFSDLVVTRAADAQTAPIISSSLIGNFFNGSVDVGAPSPKLTFEFDNAVVLGVEHVMVPTCDGTRQAERLTIRPGILRYITSEGTVSYDYSTGIPTP